MTHEYEALAEEYYDKQAHLTITLLRAGSKLALRTLVSRFFDGSQIFAEVGSGRGLLHRIASEGQVIINFDINPGMLQFAPDVGILADATALPVSVDTFDGTFAALYNIYTRPTLLTEARRVLQSSGRLLMTVLDHQGVQDNHRSSGHNLPHFPTSA